MNFSSVEIKLILWTVLSFLALVGAFFMVWKVYKALTK